MTRKLTLELGLRYSLWQQWRDENNAIASFQSEFYDPARAVTIDRADGSVVPGSGDPFNGIVLPGDSATEEALQLFPQLANLGRLYHGLPPGFAPDPKDGLQPRLGMAYALERRDDDPQRHRPLPEPAADQHQRRLRVQSAAVGDGDGHQRQRGCAGWRAAAHVPARDGDVLARLRQRELVGVERHDGSSAAVAAHRAGLVRRPLRIEPRAGAQHQPAAAGHAFRRIRA